MDTSVFGGCCDDEFRVPSHRLFQYITDGRVLPLLSETLARELEEAPETVRNLFRETIAGACERLEVEEQAAHLAQAYLKAGIVPEKYADDALHVALATVARADVIASWNYRHMVNPAQIKGFNSVNVAHGYEIIAVLTPADIGAALEESDED